MQRYGTRVTVARKTISPRAENLTALLSKLITIWRRRRASPMMTSQLQSHVSSGKGDFELPMSGFQTVHIDVGDKI